MKLWIDDFRAPPDATWTWAKNLGDALSAYFKDWDKIEEISFDHDLGVLVSLDKPLPEEHTTMPLAKIIELAASHGSKPPKWTVHSMNPVGKANLIATLESADRLYAAYKKGKDDDAAGIQSLV